MRLRSKEKADVCVSVGLTLDRCEWREQMNQVILGIHRKTYAGGTRGTNLMPASGDSGDDGNTLVVGE